MKQYYKWCLFSPLWLPILLGVIFYITMIFTPELENAFPGWISFLAAIIVISGIFGGAQYCIALRIVWTRVDFESDRSWRNGILKLPLIFAPIQVACILPFVWQDLLSLDGWANMGSLAMFDLLLGYSYVSTWLLGSAVIRWGQQLRKGMYNGNET